MEPNQSPHGPDVPGSDCVRCHTGPGRRAGGRPAGPYRSGRPPGAVPGRAPTGRGSAGPGLREGPYRAGRRGPGAAATVGSMTKWEYATVPLLVHATKQILDTWGEDGWELVQVVPGPNNPEQLVAYLKREKA